MVSIYDHQLWKFLGLFTGFLLFGNVLAVCTYSFSCSSILPTLSFTGALRDHDRIFVFALTFYGFFLPFLALSIFSKIHKQFSGFEGFIFKLEGLASGILLFFVGIIDELKGIIILDTQETHSVLTFAFMMVSFHWTYVSLECIQKENLTTSEKWWLEISWKAYNLGLALAFVSTIEWYFAYTIYYNFLVNETVEALFEYATAIDALFFPYAVSKIVNASITIEDK